MTVLTHSYVAGLKRAAAVEVTSASHQHEFNGVAALREVLGDVRQTWQDTTWILLRDDGEHRLERHTVTWYDSRENQPHRSAEWRLYYTDTDVGRTEVAAGDLIVILRREDGELAFLVAPAESTWDSQLQGLFGTPLGPGGHFVRASLDEVEDAYVIVAVELFGALGWIEDPAPPAGALSVDEAIGRFGIGLPSSRVFSAYVRELTEGELNDPDGTLRRWWDAEEALFRAIERIEVEQQLAAGFASVEDFLAYSLSVQNRRKSRAGLAFENHLEAVFQQCGLSFDRGARTEGNRTPDFLFPGIGQYRDVGFDAARLTMLGAKTTCKDRWRQVLTEAARVPAKHLCTLEPAISPAQIREMAEEQLTLVVPAHVYATYPAESAASVLTLGSFVEAVQRRQARI